jgi:hypothetical protein
MKQWILGDIMTSPWLEGSFASFIRLLKFLLGGHSDSTWWTHKRRSYVHLHRQWLDRIYVCVYPPTYIPIRLSIYIPIYLSMYWGTCLSTHSPTCLFVCLSVYQIVCDVLSYLIVADLILPYLCLFVYLSPSIQHYHILSFPVLSCL